jgi:hypothetical protein
MGALHLPIGCIKETCPLSVGTAAAAATAAVVAATGAITAAAIAAAAAAASTIAAAAAGAVAVAVAVFLLMPLLLLLLAPHMAGQSMAQSVQGGPGPHGHGGHAWLPSHTPDAFHYTSLVDALRHAEGNTSAAGPESVWRRYGRVVV